VRPNVVIKLRNTWNTYFPQDKAKGFVTGKKYSRLNPLFRRRNTWLAIPLVQLTVHAWDQLPWGNYRESFCCKASKFKVALQKIGFLCGKSVTVRGNQCKQGKFRTCIYFPWKQDIDFMRRLADAQGV
jgi:hypothetical protein